MTPLTVAFICVSYLSFTEGNEGKIKERPTNNLNGHRSNSKYNILSIIMISTINVLYQMLVDDSKKTKKKHKLYMTFDFDI